MGQERRWAIATLDEVRRLLRIRQWGADTAQLRRDRLATGCESKASGLFLPAVGGPYDGFGCRRSPVRGGWDRNSSISSSSSITDPPLKFTAGEYAGADQAQDDGGTVEAQQI
jgi:hypothetical protein